MAQLLATMEKQAAFLEPYRVSLCGGPGFQTFGPMLSQVLMPGVLHGQMYKHFLLPKLSKQEAKWWCIQGTNVNTTLTTQNYE